MASKKGRPPTSGSFKPGQSGNPSGRPRIPEHVKEAARAHTSDAILTLAEIMRDQSQAGAARVSAANSLLDRAWGKAETTANVNVTKNVRDLSTAEILAALASTGVVGEEAGGDESPAVH